jgi:hypothetical protein
MLGRRRFGPMLPDVLVGLRRPQPRHGELDRYEEGVRAQERGGEEQLKSRDARRARPGRRR